MIKPCYICKEESTPFYVMREIEGWICQECFQLFCNSFPGHDIENNELSLLQIFRLEEKISQLQTEIRVQAHNHMNFVNSVKKELQRIDPEKIVDYMERKISVHSSVRKKRKIKNEI